MTGFTSKRQMAQDKAMTRPVESDYASQVAYTRALEAYCDSLEQPEQGPVEDVVAYHSDGTRTVRIAPKRQWVGLTDKQMDEWTPEIHGVIRSIEAALRSKNT
jgi:hypothetical protein